jgi:hypothetical protein
MSPDLKTLMERSAPEPSRKFDADAVAKRSRTLRRRGRLMTASATVLLGAAVFFFFVATDPGSGNEDRSEDRSQVINPGPIEESESEIPLDDRAATFAIKALSDVGLRNPAGIYFDYLGINESILDETDPYWVARFDQLECPIELPRCEHEESPNPGSLEIEMQQNEFVVTDAEGSLEGWFDSLVGYRGSSQQTTRLVWELTKDKDRSTKELATVTASYYWTGPIPGNYYSECEAQSGTWDESKEGISLYLNSPTREEERDDLVDIATEQQVGRGQFEVRCDPIRNLDEERYEMPLVPEDLETVHVGSEVIVPGEPESAPDKEQRHSNEGIPTGPRYVVAKGTFDEGEWGDYEGQDWWFLAWADSQWTCDEFEVGNLDSDGAGWGCTELAGARESDDVVTGITFDPGGKNLLSVVFGTLTTNVATLDFELTSGEVVTVDAIEPPDTLDGGRRYFVAYLPPTENGYVIARDSNGVELHRERLCQSGCTDEEGRLS